MNPTSGRPRSNSEKSYISHATSTAGAKPATVRKMLITIKAASHSQARKGLTKIWPRWRAHTSSSMPTETPSCERDITSHRNIPASSTPPALAI